MYLIDFKNHISAFPVGTIFDYGISEPFSWRGIYAEVAFKMLDQPMTREEILENIEKAYTETFYGHKGGEYTYHNRTEIHFEENSSRYTDGEYCDDWITKISGEYSYMDEEERLVKLAFNSH